jgi:hypothetical protein
MSIGCTESDITGCSTPLISEGYDYYRPQEVIPSVKTWSKRIMVKIV